MMVLQTENSKYEIDTVSKMVRRTEGTETPTMRFGGDNVWRPFAAMSMPAIGVPVIFTWEDGGQTITSAVTLLAGKS